MARAVELAARGFGSVAPNPCVGAVLVEGGRVVAEGWHAAYGGPHAEINCLADARAKGVDPAGCVLYVTLEPCNHFGKTPPCTRAIVEAGIRSVAVGAYDPNPDVAGGGVAFLRERGIAVATGVLAGQCRDLIADFVVWKSSPLPYVFLKLATTIDGRIATRTGHSAFVSNAASRGQVHALRAAVGAVLVGAGTAAADNPRLTARLGDETPARQPLAVVAGTTLPDNPDALVLLRERAQETIFLTSEESAATQRAERLTSAGARVWAMPWLSPRTERGLDLRPALTRLRSELSCHHVLCEGGGRLAMSLMRQGLIHELWLFLAPKALGDGSAVAALTGNEVAAMDRALGLTLLSVKELQGDVWLRYRPDGAVDGLSGPENLDL
ncbi:MAG: bifunctional diaminohydroxyphosphoribosylaminopyrimidine deaminase/5-amino-6-(5-phosphoribosylamino)uracil reductase RibD [Desulfovibrionaceae bacterium]|nr:bifunctional diaminohydroxyphosphoribosylaminopyrimidine deaminase/5-amino-6-(5-phosphoribosylamino)uracil reductase RibD [Desulfovibrionaceae bacterium]MBF0513244.1 bifunctional diaminohydroxyphosphoribosylaminopyrimidine deaminase/5-amino-6-(5-phosphoribosylamino)uracil reductase RibD [Desulfovibrionaceae bacterium]